MGFHAYAMKTQFISAYNYYPKYNLSQKEQQANIPVTRPVSNIQPKAQVNFTGSRTVDFLIRNLHLDPLYHFSKYSKEEYARLSLPEIEKLRARSLEVIKDSNFDALNALDDIHTIVPIALKDMFDNFFGAGKYVVITIGRSLSTIGKALGYRIGEENVVNLPMSWSRRFMPDTTRVGDHFEMYKNITSHNEGLDKFLEYLGKIGLSKEQVKNSGKSYVLMDYCCSGDSLKGAEFLFKSDYVWGVGAKTYAVDILSALEKYDLPQTRLFKNSSEVDEPIMIDGLPLLSKTLCGSHLKTYSDVGRVLSLGETEKAVLAKPRRFAIFHKENELVKFRILDAVMRSQNVEAPKLKANVGDFQLSGQRVAPWNDYLSQTESDIRNDIQRVNFQLIKLDAADIYGTSLRRDLECLHNNLTDYYNTYKSNPYTMITYYQTRGKMQKMIENAEASLIGKDIFAK
ncbi:hypothetical protein J6A34_01855 [bacterium]|nr:hypothetical protein [bacterium]